MAGGFTEGPAACPLCGTFGRRRLRFYAAFPERIAGQAAFPAWRRPFGGGTWAMTECPACHSLSPLPYPSREEIARYYREKEVPNDWEVEHYVRLDQNPKALQATEELADQLVRLGPKGSGRLLEVGCAAGWVLHAARQRGWSVQGIEAAPKFSSFARGELGLDVAETLVADIDPDRWPRFDVIAAYDVFEHLYDPVSDLAVLRALAAPGARLVLTTPNVASPVARLWGLRWRQILPSHIHYPTAEGVEAALARAGWALERRSEPRYFDPDASVERRRRAAETAKFLARWALYLSIVVPSTRLPALRRVPPVVTGGRLSWDEFSYRVGDQPVLGDVLLVVARALPRS